MLEPIIATQCPDQRATRTVGVSVIVDGYMLGRPSIEISHQLAMARLEKWPVEIAHLITHLVALELGLLLRDKRLVRTPKILRRHTQSLRLSFGLDGLVNAHVPLLLQHLLRHRMRKRRPVSEIAGERTGIGEQRSRFAEPSHEPPTLGLLATDATTGVKQLSRTPLADDARQHRARPHVAPRKANASEQKRSLAPRGRQ